MAVSRRHSPRTLSCHHVGLDSIRGTSRTALPVRSMARRARFSDPPRINWETSREAVARRRIYPAPIAHSSGIGLRLIGRSSRSNFSIYAKSTVRGKARLHSKTLAISPIAEWPAKALPCGASAMEPFMWTFRLRLGRCRLTVPADSRPAEIIRGSYDDV